MKKIQLFFVANLPLLAAIFGFQAVATDASAQASPKAPRAKVSAAAKANVAVKAAGIKNNAKVGESFVHESGPSFVKANDATNLKDRAQNQTGEAFVRESGPSFVKYSADPTRTTKVKNVNVKAAAIKAKQ